MLSGFTGWHALVLLVIVVLIFGAAKLPGLAKSVGQSMKIFRNEVKSAESEQKPDGTGIGTGTTNTSAPNAGPSLNQSSPEVSAQQDSSKSQ